MKRNTGHKSRQNINNVKIEISLAGALLLSAAIGALAVATSRLVDSIITEGESGSSDWSIDEKEYTGI